VNVAEFNSPLAFKLTKYLVIAATFGDVIYLEYSRRRSGGPTRRTAGAVNMTNEAALSTD
jgi:hypothetical protein